MENIEVTSMSSRGQVVIPQKLRDKLGLKKGEKFVVIGDDGTLVLKKLEMPSIKDFDKLVNSTQSFVRKKGITKEDVNDAIKRARK